MYTIISVLSLSLTILSNHLHPTECTPALRVKRYGNVPYPQQYQEPSWDQAQPQQQQEQEQEQEPQGYQEPQASYTDAPGTTIKYGPDGYPEVPMDVVPAGGIERSVGQSAIFRCTSTKPGDRRVFWTRRASPMPSQARIDPDGTLTIANLQPSDFGIYECRSGSKDVEPLLVYIREAQQPSGYPPQSQYPGYSQQGAPPQQYAPQPQYPQPYTGSYEQPAGQQYPDETGQGQYPQSGYQEPPYGDSNQYQEPPQQQYPYWDGYGPKPPGYPKSGYAQPPSGAYPGVRGQYRPTTPYPSTTRVTARPPGVKTPVGAEASFVCTCLIIPQNRYCDVSWSRPDNKSLPTSAYVLQGKLVIRNVSDEDYGLYKCVSRQADRTITVILEKLPSRTSPGVAQQTTPISGQAAGEGPQATTVPEGTENAATEAGEGVTVITSTEPTAGELTTAPLVQVGDTDAVITTSAPGLNETTPVPALTTPTEPASTETTAGGEIVTTPTEPGAVSTLSTGVTTGATTEAATTQSANGTISEEPVTNEPESSVTPQLANVTSAETSTAVSATTSEGVIEGSPTTVAGAINATTTGPEVSEATTVTQAPASENATQTTVEPAPPAENATLTTVEAATETTASSPVAVANVTTVAGETPATTIITTEFTTEITTAITVSSAQPQAATTVNAAEGQPQANATTVVTTAAEVTSEATTPTEGVVTTGAAAPAEGGVTATTVAPAQTTAGQTSAPTTILTSIVTQTSIVSVTTSPAGVTSTTVAGAENTNEVGTTESPSALTTSQLTSVAAQAQETTVDEGLVSPGIQATVPASQNVTIATSPAGQVMVEPPGGVTAPMGDTVTFKCTCPSADPTNCKVNWSRPNTGMNGNMNVIQGILTIRNITDTDYGAYKCTSDESDYSVTVLIERPNTG